MNKYGALVTLILTVKNQITQKKKTILSITNPTEIGLGLNPAILDQMLLKMLPALRHITTQQKLQFLQS